MRDSGLPSSGAEQQRLKTLGFRTQLDSPGIALGG
jgi:hypothetical protein